MRIIHTMAEHLAALVERVKGRLDKGLLARLKVRARACGGA